MPRPIPPPLLVDFPERRSQSGFRFKTPFKSTCSSQASEISTDKIHAINSQCSLSSQYSEKSSASVWSTETIINPRCQQTDINEERDEPASYASATYGSSPENVCDENLHSQQELLQKEPLTNVISNENDQEASSQHPITNGVKSAMDLGAENNIDISVLNGCSGATKHRNAPKSPLKSSAPIITKTYARKSKVRVKILKPAALKKELDGESEGNVSSKNERKKQKLLPVENSDVAKMRSKLRLIAMIEAFAKDFRMVKKRYDSLKARREAAEMLSSKRAKDYQKNREWERDSQRPRNSSSDYEDEGGSPKRARSTNITSSHPKIANGGAERGAHFLEE